MIRFGACIAICAVLLPAALGNAAESAIHVESNQGRDQGHQHAPCPGCLDQAAVVDIAKFYLKQADVVYIGEPTAEILDDFPWRGGPGMRWSYRTDRPDPISDLRTVQYRGERDSGDKRTLSGSLTWQIRYQTGWLAYDRIQELVDAGTLPLEALSWPLQKIQSSFVIHARTGEFGMTKDEVIEDESEAFYERHERAKLAAKDRVNYWLRTVAEDVRN